jgi:hypothetical protein
VVLLRRLTFEVTPTVEAGAVRPGCDDGTSGAARPYSACRSGSALSEGLGATRDTAQLARVENETELRIDPLDGHEPARQCGEIYRFWAQP